MVLGTEMEPHSRSACPLQDKEERDLVKKKKASSWASKLAFHIFSVSRNSLTLSLVTIWKCKYYSNSRVHKSWHQTFTITVEISYRRTVLARWESPWLTPQNSHPSIHWRKLPESWFCVTNGPSLWMLQDRKHWVSASLGTGCPIGTHIWSDRIKSGVSPVWLRSHRRDTVQYICGGGGWNT